MRGSGDLITYVPIYVNNILIASKDDMEINYVIKILKSQFEITDLGDLMLYLETRMFYLSQKKYIKKILDDHNLKDAKISAIPMDPGYLMVNSENILNNNNLYRRLLVRYYMFQITHVRILL